MWEVGVEIPHNNITNTNTNTNTNDNNNIHHQAIRRELEPVGPTLFKDPLDTKWGVLPTLRLVGGHPPYAMYALRKNAIHGKTRSGGNHLTPSIVQTYL